MRTASGFRVACLALGTRAHRLGLRRPATATPAATACAVGTLRVLSADPDIDALDTAVIYTPHAAAIGRTYARTLYGYNLYGPPEQQTVPVPDIADGPAQLSADRRTYTFTLRPGVRYAPPVNREVTARDFITAIQRLYDKESPSPGSAVRGPHRRGRRRSGPARPTASRAWRPRRPHPHGSPWTSRPATSCRSSPGRTSPRCPGSTRPATRSGPTTTGMWSAPAPTRRPPTSPAEPIVLDRNPNWDPATDPLRKAWVDRIQVKPGVKLSSIQRAIDREDRRPVADQPRAPPSSPRCGPTRSGPAACRSTAIGMPAVPGPRDPPGGRGDRRCPGPPGGQLRHRQGRLPRRPGQTVRRPRRAGLDHPGAGLARLPAVRPVPDPGRPGRPRQGQGAAGRGRPP